MADFTPQDAPGSNITAGLLVTMNALSTGVDTFTMSGRDFLIVRNSGASPYTFTIVSTVDPYGRTGDVDADTVAAGTTKVYGPMELTGWRQSNGKLNIQGSNASLLVGIVRMPS